MVCDGRLPGAANESAGFVSADYVERAGMMVRALVWSESVGPNQWGLARQRVSERYGISAGLIRDLEYRPPKTLPAHTYARIEAAFVVLSARTFADIWGAANVTTGIYADADASTREAGAGSDAMARRG